MTKPTTLILTATTVAAFSLTACVTERIVETNPVGTTSSSTTVTTYEPGYTTTSLPTGYTTRTVSGSQYYVVGDTYYTRSPSGYTVVASPDVTTSAVVDPRGSGYVSTLPPGYTTRTYRGSDYYYSGGNYYRKDPRGYVSVPAPY